MPSGSVASTARPTSASKRNGHYADLRTATSPPKKNSPPWVRQGTVSNVVEVRTFLREGTNGVVTAEGVGDENVFGGGVAQPLAKEHFKEVRMNGNSNRR